MKQYVAAALLAMPQAALAQSFSGLGFLPSDTASWATGISGDSSTVIGQGAVGTTTPHHWRWTVQSGIVSLGSFLGYDGASEPGGISHNGAVITGSVTAANLPRLAYKWTVAGITAIGDGSNAGSPGVSGDGLVVFGADDVQHAYRSTDASGRQYLGPLLGAPFGAGGHSYSLAANFDGSVIVGFADALQQPPAPSIITPFRWTAATGMRAILQNDGSLFRGAPTGISADGSVVVGSQGNSSGIFRWTQQSSYQIITPFNPPTGIFEPKVSGDGNTIIVRDTVWTAATEPQHLTDVLTAAGCNFPGWTISGATGISFDGRTLCGEGIDPQGNREAWIATIPAPAALAPICMLLLCRARRR